MRAFRDLSIRRKLTLIIMLTSSVALLLACAAFVSYDLYTFRQAKVHDLTTLAEIIGSNSTAALTFGDSNSAKEILGALRDRKSTRLNSSHGYISYAVFCLKKKNKPTRH